MRRELGIDIETYSDVDLLKVGVYRYVDSPAFEIQLISYAFDNGPVRQLDLMTDDPEVLRVRLAEFKSYLEDGEVLKTAYNAQFERVCLSKHYGQQFTADDWSCTAVLAASLKLPRKLEGAGKALNLEDNEQKMSSGLALIRYFAKPCAPTAKNGQRTRNLPQHDPDKWALYKTYNKQDVVSERAIRNRLRPFMPIEQEQALYVLDQAINDRGVLTDSTLVHNAIEASEQLTERAMREAMKLTGLQNPNSVSQLKDWLQEADDLEVDSLNKKTVPAIIASTGNDTVKRVLELRSELAKASIKKYQAIDRAVNSDERLRGTLLFYGAGTGRWAGRIFQPQNLPQNHLEDLALARELLRAGLYEDIDLLYGSVSDTLSQLVRTTLIPKPGCRFLVADFSAIEARVIAWYAKEKWRLEVFATHGKIYEASASQMFHVPIESIAKHQPNYALRQKGKVAELALGYGGAAGAMIAIGALEKGLTKEELPGLVKAWRKASPMITKFWWDVGDAAIEAVATGRPQETHGLLFEARSGYLFIRLPSGRRLAYPRAAVEDDDRGRAQLTYYGIEQGKKVWGRLETYGPKLVENIVQATARDLLAHGMMNLDAAGYPICFHVHDEAIVETDKGSLEEMIALLTDTPEWAKTIPLKADGYECEFYRKE